MPFAFVQSQVHWLACIRSLNSVARKCTSQQASFCQLVWLIFATSSLSFLFVCSKKENMGVPWGDRGGCGDQETIAPRPEKGALVIRQHCISSVIPSLQMQRPAWKPTGCPAGIHAMLGALWLGVNQYQWIVQTCPQWFPAFISSTAGQSAPRGYLGSVFRWSHISCV